MIKLNVSAANIAVEEKETLTEGRVGLLCQFRFTDEWAGLAKTAVFDGADSRDVILKSDMVAVPAECLSTEGYSLSVGVYGKDAAGDIVIPTVYATVGKIQRSAYPSGKEPAAPTPDVVAQIQQAAANAEAMARSVRDDADLGKFIGPAGEPGGWYTPEIKQPIKGAMVVNFSPSKEGMPEAEAKSIILPQGEAGADGGYYTPAVTQPDENTMHVEFMPSKADMPAVDPTDITLPNGSGGGGSGADGKSAYEYAVEGGYTGTETEFAEKLAQDMPTTLPNPNALTFTGAVTGSYDGSEAVTVEIPSGGGSGELDLSVLGWKTYQTITVSGDDISSVKFTDFTVAFKECGFLQKSVAGTSIGLQYKINGKPIADNLFYNFQNAARYSEIFFTCAGIDGKYCVEFNLEHTSGGNAGDVNQLIHSKVPVQTINSVEVYPRTTGKYFADGCEFTLVYR